jgi:hypothetical protein
MFSHQTKVDSSSGVATATQVRQSGDRFQVSLLNATGSGTVTITVRPGSKIDAFESITDGTISVSNPTTLYVIGKVNAVKATSSNSGDSFTLEVLG